MQKISVFFSVFVTYSLSGINPQDAQPFPIDNNKAVELLINAAKECSITPTLQPGFLHDACSQESPNNLLMLADLCAPIEAQNPQTGNNAVPLNGTNNDHVNLPNNEEQTLLFLAAQAKTVGLLKTLIEHGASLLHKDNDGNTVLHVAAEAGNMVIVKEIMREMRNQKVDLNIPNNNGVYPIHLAAGAPNRHADKIVELFLTGENAKLNANLKDNKGDTPSHYAVRENRYEAGDSRYQTTETLELLLKFEADVDVQNEKGETPLCHTIYNRYGTIRARFLIENGARLSLDGKTVLEFVENHERNKPALIAFLKAVTQNLADKEEASRKRPLYSRPNTKESGISEPEKKART